jgi:hypothetical protein
MVHRTPEVEDMDGEAGYGVGLAEEAAGVQVRVLRRPASHDLLVKQNLPASPGQGFFKKFYFTNYRGILNGNLVSTVLIQYILEHFTTKVALQSLEESIGENIFLKLWIRIGSGSCSFRQ